MAGRRALGCRRADPRIVVKHMLKHGILASDAGALGLGPEGEAIFGRRHFQELVAAFTTPLLLAVRHGSADLGTIDPLSIEGLRSSVPVILLAGRSWRVLDVDWPRRMVRVEPAVEQGRSRWFGSARALHADLARSIEQVIVTGSSGVTLSRRAQDLLDLLREHFAFVDAETLPIVVSSDDEVRIWTFAGGHANTMLAAGLLRKGLAVKRADSFSISVGSTSVEDVARVLRAIDPETLEAPVPQRLIRELKFGDCLPILCAQAVLAARLADPVAVTAVLRRPHRCIARP